MQVIDIEKFDKQMEKEKLQTKAKTKLKNMETTHEAKRSFSEKIITDPCAGAKRVDKVKEEQNHVKGALQIDKILMDLETKKAKTDMLLNKVEAKTFQTLDQELDAFIETPIGQTANEHVNNLLTLIYNDQLKKKLLKNNLQANPIIKRNNERVVYNIVNKLPLVIQYPLFVAFEVVKTEDQYKEIALFQQRQQLLKQQQQQPEPEPEKKEEEKKE